MQSENLAPALLAALDDWRLVLGEANVRLDDPADPREGRRTFGRNVRVPATIFPASSEEVGAAVTIAARRGIGLHPVSRGCNWGLGSRAPRRDGDVVIDLSRLNRISGFDAADGLVHVEPGVTFRQLFEYLSDRNCDYFLPSIGGPVMASVLANALDRGDAVFCDRWKSISDLTVVLPDGSVVETGHMAGTPLAGRGIPPAGPIVEGLFSQSGFGIVTGAWLRLEPLPANISAWLIEIGERDNLPGFVSTARELQRIGTIPDRSFILWNGIKFMARNARRADYSAEDIERGQLDHWQSSGFVTGETPAVLAARDALVGERFGTAGLNSQRFEIRVGGRWAEGARDVFDVPRQTNLRTVYWRHEQAPDLENADPDRDGCGLIWLCLALPFDGVAIRDFAVWCRSRLAEAGIDLNFGLEAANFRTALAYITLSYLRGEAENAAACNCHDEIMAEAVRRGFMPYRLANGLTPPSGRQDPALDQLLTRIRKSLYSQDITDSTRRYSK